MNKISIVKTAVLGLCLALPGAQAGVIAGTGSVGANTIGAVSADAFKLNTDGIGHVLLVPYYNVQGDNALVLSLVNADSNNNAKAIKLRWRGAANGDSLFSMTVYLAPNDVWNAAITRNPLTGLAQIVSGDASCTQPSVGTATPFSAARLSPAMSATERANQTREGLIEIINMADIPPSDVAGSLYQAVAGGARSCAGAAVQATLKDATSEPVAAALGFAGPTGGLRANWTLINVAQTLTFSGRALALQAVGQANGQPGRANFQFFPQSETSAGNVDALSADPLLRNEPLATKTADARVTYYVSASLPLVKPLLSDLPDLSTPYVNGMADPMAQAAHLSKLLSVKFLRNDYASDAAIAAANDWVFSLPTKRYSVAIDHLRGLPVYSVVTGFDSREYFSTDNTTLRNGQVCTDQAFRFYDRDGAYKTEGDKLSSTSAQLALCGVTAVSRFADASAFGASVTVQAIGNRAFVNGWGNVDLSNAYTGTPVMGLSLFKASNPNAAPGVSGNYGLTSIHRATR